MNYKNLLISILFLFAAGYIYDKFKIKIDKDDKEDDLNIIKKYLLNDKENYIIHNLSSIKKPILWIFIDYKKNSRLWESFGSRTSYELNQDYLYLTIRSIIQHCSEDFHLILIDDQSFSKLLPEWKINLNNISSPLKDSIINLGLMKLLYKYGGLVIDNSFIVFKSLSPLYNKIKKTNKMSVGQFNNNSIDAHVIHFMPSIKFIGSLKECPKIKELINHYEILISNDYTNSSILENSINKWLLLNAENEEIN